MNHKDQKETKTLFVVGDPHSSVVLPVGTQNILMEKIKKASTVIVEGDTFYQPKTKGSPEVK